MTKTEKYDFGPRIGAAYRINDRTVVRSGYGLFFDTVPISYYQDSVENLPWIREDQQSLSAFQFGLPPSEGFIGYLLDDPPIGSFTPGPNTFQVGFKNSFVHHWNFSAQRQLGNSMVTEIAYSGHWADRLNWRRNLNTAEPRSPNAQIPTTVHPQFRRALPFAIFEDGLIVLDNWFETTSEAKSLHHAVTGRFEKRYRGDHIHQFVHVRQNAESCATLQRRQQRHGQPHPEHLRSGGRLGAGAEPSQVPIRILLPLRSAFRPRPAVRQRRFRRCPSNHRRLAGEWDLPVAVGLPDHGPSIGRPTRRRHGRRCPTRPGVRAESAAW